MEINGRHESYGTSVPTTIPQRQMKKSSIPLSSRFFGRTTKPDQTSVTLRTVGIFYDETGEQFIKVKQNNSTKLKKLHFSAQLYYKEREITFGNKGCLMFVENDFVAEVEIEQPNLLDEAENFDNAKAVLFRQLRIVRVLSDSSLEKVTQYRQSLLYGLENVLKLSSENSDSGLACIELLKIVENLSKSGTLCNNCVCQEIIQAYFLNEDLKSKAAIVYEIENSFEAKKTFQIFGLEPERDSECLYRSLLKLLSINSKRHTNALMELAPDHLRELLNDVCEEKLIFISKKDVQVFTDMVNVLNKNIFFDPLLNLQQRWIQHIKSMDTDQLKNIFPTTNYIYLYLCKSLEELIVQISDMTGISEFDLLQFDSSGWRKKDKIKWKKADVVTKCLERQYNFLFCLLDHFDFGKNSKREPFKYDFNSQSNSLNIPDELCVWYYLLHDTLVEILPENCTPPVVEKTLQNYLKLFFETKSDQLEILRIATQNTIQFIIQLVRNTSSFSSDSNYYTPGCTLRTAGKFVDSTGKQFIEVRISTLKSSNNFNFSAALMYENMKIVLHSEGCLMVVDDDLVAKAKIEQPNLLEDTRSFEDAKTSLLRQLQIVRVFTNGSLDKVERNRKNLLREVKTILEQSTKDKDCRLASIELSEIVENLNKLEKICNSSVCQALEKTRHLSEELKIYAANIDEEEKICCKKENAFKKLGLQPANDSLFLYQGLRQLLNENGEHYLKFLLKDVQDQLRESLLAISQEKLVLITQNDIKLFADMSSALNNEVFAKPLLNLQQRWVKKINSLEIGRGNSVHSTTTNIFYFLCKSLDELIVQISDKTNIAKSDLIHFDSSGWKMNDRISWKKEDITTNCLERQYNFLFRLLDHFDFGKSCNPKTFKYNIKLVLSATRIPSVLNLFESFVSRKPVDHSESELSLLDVPEEKCVWYYLLDDTLFYILPEDCNRNLIKSLVRSYLKLVRQIKQEQLEALRVATHTTIQFIVQVIPFMPLDADVSSTDQQILQIQFDIISSQLSNTSNYRHLVQVFCSYWEARSEFIVKIVSEMNHSKIELLKEELLTIALLALEKPVDNSILLPFLRAYVELLTELREVPFDWFIKNIPDVDMQVFVRRQKVEVVDNKLKDRPARTYRVKDPKDFVDFLQCQGSNMVEPKHYVIEVLLELLSHVISQLQRDTWVLKGQLSPVDQLSTTRELMSTIKSSLRHLKEQDEYVSFEKFYKESVEPFASLVRHSTSEKDFTTRAHLLKESFWFIRKQNEVDLATVLQEYKKLNPNMNLETLKKPYELYLEHFKVFMELAVGKDYPTAAALVAKDVTKLISSDKHFTAWDLNFKRHKIPHILAGLGAVWSILVSKDVSSTGRYLSPNCIQILCVLRLLSVDTSTPGIEKHLAQVLTGQGKSLILALVSALLALTGHKVNIGCYSRYLVERDQENFNEFYSTLSVTDVTYGPLSSLMEKFINPKIGGKTMGLRNLVEDLLLKETPNQSNKLITSSLDDSILLVDEVDVFFSKQFYGNTYNPGAFPMIPGIDKIQEFIWETVTNKDLSVESVMVKVQKVMDSATFMLMESFQTFRARKNNYKILSDNGELKNYTNASLLNEHLRGMIETAIDVFVSPASKWSEYKLNSSEQISSKANEEFVTHSVNGYKNSFNYFRLKKNNFISTVNGVKNYGYLLINCGSLSFAMLPMNYPLILGVSGTLTDLSNFEKETIENLYEIKQISAMPTFYGSSNLCFDSIANFHCFPTKSGWSNHIFSQINKVVQANRAVIIFFESDVELSAFQSAYEGQLDRLNVLTENTEEKEKFIDEAGVSKTITLATRGMGRGVDYKTSLQVEKNGGVHVIQTFFSIDIKEETQIKGRTARQDNKGSYELVVCREDLMRCKLISHDIDDVNDDGDAYFKLSVERLILSTETNLSISKAVERNKSKHNATMDYFRSFFKS